MGSSKNLATFSHREYPFGPQGPTLEVWVREEIVRKGHTIAVLGQEPLGPLAATAEIRMTYYKSFPVVCGTCRKRSRTEVVPYDGPHPKILNCSSCGAEAIQPGE